MLIALIALLVFAAVALLVVGVGRRVPTAMEERILDFRSRAAVTMEDGTDLTIPFGDRILRPSVEAMARTARSVMPASMLANLEKQLVMAGNPISVNGFVVIWAVCVFFMTGFLLFAIAMVGAGLNFKAGLLLLLFGMVGWMLPRIWLQGRVKMRQKAVIKTLPDALDLVTTCVEAGLGLDAALARVAEKSSGSLADEISRMMRDVAMGKLRREALTEMAERVGVEELSSFINSVIQAEQLGVGISQVLRVQSDQLRMRRRQRAEQAAHEAPIKMIFPLVLFIFPAFMIVILGPAVIRIGQSLVK